MNCCNIVHTTNIIIKHCQIHIHIFWINLNTVLASIAGYFTLTRSNVSLCRNFPVSLFLSIKLKWRYFSDWICNLIVLRENYEDFFNLRCNATCLICLTYDIPFCWANKNNNQKPTSNTMLWAFKDSIWQQGFIFKGFSKSTKQKNSAGFLK